MKKQDREEFQAYLQACTDGQLYGVLEKETKAYRWKYVRLVKEELYWRGLVIRP